MFFISGQVSGTQKEFRTKITNYQNININYTPV